VATDSSLQRCPAKSRGGSNSGPNGGAGHRPAAASAHRREIAPDSAGGPEPVTSFTAEAARDGTVWGNINTGKTAMAKAGQRSPLTPPAIRRYRATYQQAYAS